MTSEDVKTCAAPYHWVVRRRLHLCSAIALCLIVGVPVAGCFDSGPVYYPTGAECAPGTNPDCIGDCTLEELVDPLMCEGEVCLVLNPNQQDIVGLCSAPCNVDADCTPHDRCIQLVEGAFCLRACEDDGDCYDRSVCRSVSGTFTRFCLADVF